MRKSIYTDGLGHKNPISAASRVGNLLMSGIIGGVDPATGKPAVGLAAQCEWLFKHVREIVEAGGGTTDDIVKVMIYLTDHNDREALNQESTKMFPEPDNRPARQAMPGNPNPDRLIECDFVAFIED